MVLENIQLLKMRFLKITIFTISNCSETQLYICMNNLYIIDKLSSTESELNKVGILSM